MLIFKQIPRLVNLYISQFEKIVNFQTNSIQCPCKIALGQFAKFPSGKQIWERASHLVGGNIVDIASRNVNRFPVGSNYTLCPKPLS